MEICFRNLNISDYIKKTAVSSEGTIPQPLTATHPSGAAPGGRVLPLAMSSAKLRRRRVAEPGAVLKTVCSTGGPGTPRGPVAVYGWRGHKEDIRRNRSPSIASVQLRK